MKRSRACHVDGTPGGHCDHRLADGCTTPGARQGEDRGQRTSRSLSNLHQNTNYTAMYGISGKDDLLNPSGRRTIHGRRGTIPARLVWISRAGRWGRCWDYGNGTQSNQGTETFAYHWLSRTCSRRRQRHVPGAVAGFARADKAMRRMLTETTSSNAQTDLTWIFPVSYWYPPVFWQAASRFSNATNITDVRNRRPVLYPPQQAQRYHEPVQKGHAFRRRLLPDQGRKTPSWNSPGSRVNVALSDAKHKMVSMPNIIAATTTNTGLTAASGTPILQPAGTWAPPATELQYCSSWAARRRSRATSSFRSIPRTLRTSSPPARALTAWTSVKAAPENKTTAMVLIGVGVIAVAVAGWLFFRPAGETLPDEDTRAAMERSDRIRAGSANGEPSCRSKTGPRRAG